MKKNKKHILVLVVIFVCFLLLAAKRGAINAISDCSSRHNCSEEDYPYCVPNVNFNDCAGVYKCWDGDILGDLNDGDCTYKYDPNPPADATPWPTPTIDTSDVCQITPTSVEYNYSDYISIRNANIEADKKYYVILETSSDSVADGPYTPQEEGLIKILFLANDPLQESVRFTVRRGPIIRDFICSGGIYVKKKENDDKIVDICQGNDECKKCFNSKETVKETGGEYIYEDGGAWTALGCIPTEPTELIKWIFPYLLGFGGLAAFLLIVFAGIQIMTSSGNPEKLKAGKELITSAITGLIFIILSLFLLRVIGVDILHIPGLK